MQLCYFKIIFQISRFNYRCRFYIYIAIIFLLVYTFDVQNILTQYYFTHLKKIL